ncbi:phage distal tail protein [Sporosarcina psychrophila]|uniref:Phage tail protein n=1 Tax=Sporosarcina psychrophila TaxID=1476 RepID=A0ABV2KBC5_SPOPS
MITNLKITNKRGEEFEFGHQNRITKGLNLSGLIADVNFSAGSGAGSKYQNTRLSNREFEIEFMMMKAQYDEVQMDGKRGDLYSIFNPELNPLRLDITMSDDKKYYLDANLQSTPIVPPDKATNNNGAWQRVLLQFLATDPYIYEKDSRRVEIAEWIGAFEFPLCIESGVGFEVGYRSQSMFVDVDNAGQSKTGMSITFRALATVTHPALINVETQEELKLNITMTKGDVVEVSTYDGAFGITLIRGGTRSDEFNAIGLYSTFLQLEPGNNVFRYDALSGVDNMEISLTYRAKSVGV